ncbi:glutamate--tRNA ligase [Candidatus Woesearchaeota archaeon]|nr:glutamate--tRNA ligase [Candidatus Woesearchaeota archaeon]
MKDIVRKYVLKNAAEFGGKANPGVILGLVLREKPELKEDVPRLRKEIDILCMEVAKLPLEQIKEELEKVAGDLPVEEKKETVEGPLKPLPKAVKGKVVVRMAPSPSGPLHIGHAYGVSLNSEYAKMYGGKLILRIEDTNPENIYPAAYKLIPEDAQWLTDRNVREMYVQSSRLGMYYDYAEQLVRQGKVYLCTCDADKWREMKSKGDACACRSLPIEENQERFAKMFSSYAEGEVVARLKTDIKHKNPALRDFAIMRIVEHVHPKTGKEQRVWPLMVFSVAIDDHEMGITHVLNGKDHMDNAMKERMIMDCFGWSYPEYKHWGMISFIGFDLSTSKTRRAIEQKEYVGWDDIRLPFMPALRRRGYQAAAFRKYAMEMGLSQNDKTVSLEEFWKNINAFNREIIEPKANRYFCVEKPIAVTITGAPKKRVLFDLHPSFPKRGQREFNTTGEVYIAENDYNLLTEGVIHRLMDYCNFQIKKGKWVFVSEEYEDYKNAEHRGMIIHWLPMQRHPARITVMLEDGTTAQGLGEEQMTTLKVGDIVQLERMFFARVDEVEEDMITLWYLHR